MASTVTWRSSIASSNAACVFGEARLISSASTMLANTPPGRNSKRLPVREKTVTPVTSDGNRSGVNWMRFHSDANDAAIALASVVLPTPGTSSISRWPSAARHTSDSLMASPLPTSACAMFSDDGFEHSLKRVG